MKVGFTGTQRGMSNKQAWEFFNQLVLLMPSEFHHGDCVGSDAEAHKKARHLMARIIKHPPENKRKQAFMLADESRPYAPYLVRNKNIVNETQFLIVTPGEMEEKLRSGTWSTVRYARKLGHEIRIIFPDGSVKVEEGRPPQQA